MLDTVDFNHVQHISFTQSRLTDAVSVILSELLSYEHPSKVRGLFKDSKTDIFIPLKSYELLAAFCKNPKLAIVIAIFQESTSHIVTDSGS